MQSGSYVRPDHHQDVAEDTSIERFDSTPPAPTPNHFVPYDDFDGECLCGSFERDDHLIDTCRACDIAVEVEFCDIKSDSKFRGGMRIVRKLAFVG